MGLLHTPAGRVGFAGRRGAGLSDAGRTSRRGRRCTCVRAAVRAFDSVL